MFGMATTSARLEVIDALTITLQPQNVVVDVNSTVIVPCKATVVPSLDVNYAWYYEVSDINGFCTCNSPSRTWKSNLTVWTSMHVDTTRPSSSGHTAATLDSCILSTFRSTMRADIRARRRLPYRGIGLPPMSLSLARLDLVQVRSYQYALYSFSRSVVLQS